MKAIPNNESSFWRPVPLLIPQIVRRPMLKYFGHISRSTAGSGQVMLQIITAFFPPAAGDHIVKSCDIVEAFPDQPDGVGKAYVIPQQQIETCTASHGAHVQHAFSPGTVPGIDSHQMFQGMELSIAQIITAIGCFHTDIISDCITIHTGDIHARLQTVMINGKAGDRIHFPHRPTTGVQYA